MGAALATRPDVLLLDEPTNHLDREVTGPLVASLKSYGGVGLIVSHDRSVHDELTTRTIRIDHGDVRLWSGSYSAARAEWEAAQAEELDALEVAKQERRTLQRRLADQRRASEAKIARKRRVFRTSAATGNIDARGAAAAARHAEGERAGLQRQAVTRRWLERGIADLESSPTRRQRGGDISFDWEPSPRRRIFTHEGPVRIDGEVLIDSANVTVERQDRVHLEGPNGAGKTTLLRALVAASDIPADRLLWLPQDLTAYERSEVVAGLLALAPDVRGRVLAIAALLGLDPDRVLASDLVSPGEASKLAIARGLGLQPWVLVLDEPTNHLDLPSIERLEAALAAYPGALLMVTHDDRLAAAVTDTTWTIAEGRLAT